MYTYRQNLIFNYVIRQTLIEKFLNRQSPNSDLSDLQIPTSEIGDLQIASNFANFRIRGWAKFSKPRRIAKIRMHLKNFVFFVGHDHRNDGSRAAPAVHETPRYLCK